MKQKIVYIIPTYNEKENIGAMLQKVVRILSKLKKYTWTVLVADDKSDDGTEEIVKKFAKKDKRVILFSGPKNGLGAAMIRAYNYSMKNLKGDIVIANEADFSFDPEEVPFMIKKIESGTDVVVASRRLIDLDSWPLGRRITHFVANNFFAGIIAGVKEVEDHNSAFKAIRVKGVLDKLNFKNFPKGFGFFNYLIYSLSRITSNIYEFKTIFRPRTKGESKIGLSPKYIKTFTRDVAEYTLSCLKIRLDRKFK